MTLQNLIDYYQWQNIDLWEGCTVPSPFNINIVIDTIMSRCGLLTPIYGDPDVFKELTSMWFLKNQWNFEHLAKVYNASYSPIENVYESDHWTEGHTGTDKRALSGTDTDTLSGTDTDTLSGKDIDTLSGSDSVQASGSDGLQHGLTTEHQVSAYNSGTYQPDSKDISSGTDTTTFGKKDTTTYGKKDTMEYGKKDTINYGKVDTVNYGKKDDFTHGHIVTYNRLRHGNIGITTNNELINQETAMLEKFNPYDWIAAKYERENFLQVY